MVGTKRYGVDGRPHLAVRQFGPNKGPEYRVSRGEYYSVDGYWLRDGVLAAIGERD
jgi:hypothetical protein